MSIGFNNSQIHDIDLNYIVMIIKLLFEKVNKIQFGFPYLYYKNKNTYGLNLNKLLT